MKGFRATIIVLCVALVCTATALARDIRGTGGNDRIGGTSRADTIRGLAGDDHLGGGDGPDVIIGGPGNDAMGGDDGADRLSGGSGDDHLYGDFGPFPSGELAPSRLDGGSGNDRLEPGQGDNRVDGGEGNDEVLAANGGRDVIDCGPGDDSVTVDRGQIDRTTHCEHVTTRASGYPRVTPSSGGMATRFAIRYSVPWLEEPFDNKLDVWATGPRKGCSGRAAFDQFAGRIRLRPADMKRRRWCQGTYTVEAVLTEYEGDDFAGPYFTQIGVARFAVKR